MNKAHLSLVCVLLFSLVGCPTVDPQENVFRGRPLEVTDTGCHYPMYVATFERDARDSRNQYLRVLIYGHGALADELGRHEDWWWEFVYAKGLSENRSLFEIEYGEELAEVPCGFVALQEYPEVKSLVSWKVIEGRPN